MGVGGRPEAAGDRDGEAGVWVEGSAVYQVLVDLDGSTTVTVRLYRWSQPGLGVAHRSRFDPTRASTSSGKEICRGA